MASAAEFSPTLATPNAGIERQADGYTSGTISGLRYSGAVRGTVQTITFGPKWACLVWEHDMPREELIETCKARYAKGEDVESLIGFLRSSGCSKPESIGIISEGCGVGLAKAKELVHFSPTWEFRRKADDEFHESLADAVSRIGKSEEEG